MTVLKTLRGTPTDLASDGPIRGLYERMLNGSTNSSIANDFLREQLARVSDASNPLPAQVHDLAGWVEHNCAAVAAQYGDYLEARKEGGERRFFRSKAQALYFLQRVAPTKLVDGAWLYGVLKHWQDYRYSGLLTTYLEELGDGDPGQNHVAIYRRLLAVEGCDSDQGLTDEHFLQGAIQLALGQCADAFLPQVLGYNLGYEQLPLHLLISAYELSELGIDPYYFTLHVTIDNASTGHAHRAVEAVKALAPVGVEGESFWQHVAHGYALNDLGIGSRQVIEQFDLETELVAMLERKRPFGQHMHSDFCRFDGKTVNQWLAQPGHVPAFLKALQHKGWIKRHQNPQDSRFWTLIEGTGAAMFGVFSGYEKQLLHDWIAGEWADEQPVPSGRRSASIKAAPVTDDLETAALQQALRNQPTERQFELLMPWLGPQRHARPAGLFATRQFIQLCARVR